MHTCSATSRAMGHREPSHSSWQFSTAGMQSAGHPGGRPEAKDAAVRRRWAVFEAFFTSDFLVISRSL